MPANQPDIKLVLDEDGIIQEASVSTSFSDETMSAWVGRSWSDTVADEGAPKISSMLESAREGGVSGVRQVNQRFPSGLELPIEYTAVWLGGPGAAAVVIGKNLEAVTELQSRLVSVQEALERDYWKLREVETRYRQLFEASNEAVLLVRADNLRIVEANPAAARALGSPTQRPQRIVDRDLLSDIRKEERDAVRAMFVRAREQGKAPGILLHLGSHGEPWMMRASLIRSDNGPVFLLQLAPTSTGATEHGKPAPASTDELLAHSPDGFIVLDRTGTIIKANPAFVEMVQVGSEVAVIGERLERWLTRHSADLDIMLANVSRVGAVRLFPTTLRGELGSEMDVEISAFGDRRENPERMGMLVRDVGHRMVSHPEGNSSLSAALSTLTRQVGNTSMRSLVRHTVEVVEKHFIRTALENTGGNRTAAAQLLGLSRQGLYAKLGRYDLDGNTLDRSDSAD